MAEEHENWRLGINLPASEAAAHRPAPEIAPPAARQLEPPAARLDRPFYILTVEHFSYALIVAFTLVTRLAALGRRPLTASEAAHAMLDQAIARGGLAELSAITSRSALMHLVEAGLFITAGTTDFTARLGFALAGILLVLIALSMRPWVGRAGAIALAAMIAVSPTFTWYSRANADVLPALALTLLSLRLALGFIQRPSIWRAAVCGLVGGVTLAAQPWSFVTGAILALTALVMAASEAVIGHRFGERFNYWCRLHLHQAVLGVLLAGAVWFAVATALLRKGAAGWPSLNPVAILTGPTAVIEAGAWFHLPLLSLYEFLLALGAAAGIVAFIALRLRSRFSAWCFIWTVLAIGLGFAADERAPEAALRMLLPMALMAALAAEYLYASQLWRYLRPLVAVLVVATIFMQAMTSFVHCAPDADQAPWRRHALLFWTRPATTWQAKAEFVRLRNSFPQGQGWVPAKVWFGAVNGHEATEASRWYLREFAPADRETDAEVIVAPGADASAAAGFERREFALQEHWSPDLRGASAVDVIKFFLTSRAWSALAANESAVAFRLPAAAASSAPAGIATAAAVATATPSSTPVASSSPSPTPEESPTPARVAASPVATSRASPLATTTPTPMGTPPSIARPTPLATASEPAATPTPEPEPTPSADLNF